MIKRASRILNVLVISLATFAISQGASVQAATLPVVAHQVPLEKGLQTPTRLAVATDGTLYVVEPTKRAVLKYGTNGKLLQTITVPGIPQGVAVTASGALLVSQGTFVAQYDQNGTEIRRLAGQFLGASGIALDDSGQIFVIDSKGRNVQIFDANGAYVSRFDSLGSAAGQFRYPSGIAFEKVSKQIVVIDSLGGMVQFFDTKGSFVRSIGSNGTGPLKFMHPYGIAFEYLSGNAVRMYVSDSMLRSIQVIDPTGAGTFISYIDPAGGRSHGTLGDMAFDQIGKRLYVINGHGSISVYQISDGSAVVTSVTPDPAAATVITSSAQTGGAPVSVPAVANVSPLTLSMVADGSSVSSNVIDVSGTVTSVASVTVNNVLVPVVNGFFSTAVALQDGANVITITAADLSGTSWTEQRTVTWSAGLPDIRVATSDVIVTDKATLLLSGSADARVIVSVAGVPADTVRDRWSALVNLNPGLNTIEIQGVDLNGLAAASKRTVFYSPAAPVLNIVAPGEDVMTSAKRITMRGEVVSGSDVSVAATVNGTPVTVKASNGNFMIPVEFSAAGPYTVTVTATLPGGAVSTVSRTVIYKAK